MAASGAAANAASNGRASSSPIIDEFPLTGTNDLPDPRKHAYRDDLADVALAGQVIASHYARPVMRALKSIADLRETPEPDGEIIASLNEGAPFLLLDCRGDWAWGYGGREKLVGYIPVRALG